MGLWKPDCGIPKALGVSDVQSGCGSGHVPGTTVRHAGRRQASGLLVKGFKVALGGREKQKVTQGAYSLLLTRKRVSQQPGLGEHVEMET